MSIDIFGQIERVLRSVLYSRVDRIGVWWNYRVSLADRHLYERDLDRKLRCQNSEDEEGDALRLTIYESMTSLYERDHLLSQCVKYGVGLPKREDPDFYEKIAEPDLFSLTNEGKTKLLAAIRVAKLERLERVKSLALALSGVLGMVVALVSLL